MIWLFTIIRQNEQTFINLLKRPACPTVFLFAQLQSWTNSGSEWFLPQHSTSWMHNVYKNCHLCIEKMFWKHDKKQTNKKRAYNVHYYFLCIRSLISLYLYCISSTDWFTQSRRTVEGFLLHGTITFIFGQPVWPGKATMFSPASCVNPGHNAMENQHIIWLL